MNIKLKIKTDKKIKLQRGYIKTQLIAAGKIILLINVFLCNSDRTSSNDRPWPTSRTLE